MDRPDDITKLEILGIRRAILRGNRLKSWYAGMIPNEQLIILTRIFFGGLKVRGDATAIASASGY